MTRAIFYTKYPALFLLKNGNHLVLLERSNTLRGQCIAQKVRIRGKVNNDPCNECGCHFHKMHCSICLCKCECSPCTFNAFQSDCRFWVFFFEQPRKLNVLSEKVIDLGMPHFGNNIRKTNTKPNKAAATTTTNFTLCCCFIQYYTTLYT